MEKYQIVKGCVEWDAVCVEIIHSDNDRVNPLPCSVIRDDADRFCKDLSKAMPGKKIRITMHARIRAVYQDGERILTRDMRDFYLLTDEEYASTKLLDQSVGEYF